MVIYLLLNKANSMIYVGQTIGRLHDRWVKHLSQARIGSMSAIAKAIRKHGGDNFLVLWIDSADSLEELNRLETEYIAAYQSIVPNGYNLQPGGDNRRAHLTTIEKCRRASTGKQPGLGWRPNAEQRKRLSDAVRGRKLPPRSKEHSNKIRLALLGKPGKRGWRHSEETKAKLSEKRRIYKVNDEDLKSLYSSGLSCPQISKRFGASTGAISLRLRKAGVRMNKGPRPNAQGKSPTGLDLNGLVAAMNAVRNNTPPAWEPHGI